MMAEIPTKSRREQNIISRNSGPIIGLGMAIPILILYFFIAIPAVDQRFSLLVNTIAFAIVLYVAALSLDLEVGSMGLPNFGKVAFIALGAYMVVILWDGFQVLGFSDIALPLAIIGALIVTGFFGWIVAIPTVKLRADYFAIMTIAGGELVRLVVLNEKRYFWQTRTAGDFIIKEQLINFDFKRQFTELNFFGIDFSTEVTFKSYFGFIEDFIVSLTGFSPSDWLGPIKIFDIALIILFIFFLLVVYWIVEMIRNAPYGRTLRAIREDDITVTSVGKDVFRFRYQVTIVAAVICGFAGFLWIMVSPVFEPNDFRPFVTFDLFVLVIIGGIGNSRGVAAGTALIAMFLRSAQIEAVRQQLSFTIGGDIPIIGDILNLMKIEINVTPDDARLVLMGVILILFLLYKPAGLIPERRSDNTRYMKLLTDEERQRSDDGVHVRQSVSEQERLGIREVNKDEPAPKAKNMEDDQS
jgi:branched-chain amino acid transport system permease protein